jgi:hypothetical protein
MLLEREAEAFDLAASRASGTRVRDVTAQASAACEQLVICYREYLKPRVSVDSVQDAGLEARDHGPARRC